MPVVINDFEVVVDNPSQPSQPATTTEEPPTPSKRGATPHEVENILRRERERLARVQAH